MSGRDEDRALSYRSFHLRQGLSEVAPNEEGEASTLQALTADVIAPKVLVSVLVELDGAYPLSLS